MAGVVHYGRIGQQYMDRRLFEFSFRMECKVRVSAAQIFNTLSELLHPNDIVEIARTDSLMWNVVVGSEAAAGILRDCGYIDMNGRATRVVSVSHQVVEVRCHWLPAYVKDEFLKYIFSDFGRVQEIKRETTVLGAGLERQNGVRVVVLETDDVVKGNIPHLMRFEGNISMLVTMSGRPPLCLRCNTIGHVRRDCNTTVNRQQPPQPKRSYATAVAPPEPIRNREETEEVTEAAIDEDMGEVTEEKEEDVPVGETVAVEEGKVEEGEETQEQPGMDKKPDGHGVRRTWDDSEGFDLLAASEGTLYIDDKESQWTTVKRSKTTPDRTPNCGTDG